MPRRLWCALVALQLCMTWAVAADSGLSQLIGEQVLEVPERVHVCLLGFQDASPLPPERLRSLLEATLPWHQPFSIDTGEHLRINYTLTYSVSSDARITQYEDLVASQIHQSVSTEVAAASAQNTLDGVDNLLQHVLSSSHHGVEVTAVEKGLLDAVYADANRDDKDLLTLMLIRPSRERIASALRLRLLNDRTLSKWIKADSKVEIRYGMVHKGAGGTSHRFKTWISSQPYACVDLEAGPITYGTALYKEAAVCPAVFALAESPPPPMMEEANLVSLTVSAVRHLFVPDLPTVSLPAPRTIYVAIIVLRDHVDFDALSLAHRLPIAAGQEAYQIDVKFIKKQLSGLIRDYQRIEVLSGQHSLHDHTRLAVALAKARLADSSHELHPDTRLYTMRSKPFIDSPSLIAELKAASDLLVGPLIASVAGVGGQNDDNGFGPPVVLPVYVFSLLGHDAATLFDQNEPLVATRDCVLVRQSNLSAVASHFFTQGRAILHDLRNPTRHILAGVTSVLGGLVEPTRRFSARHAAPTHDYLWANGHQPFGVLSSGLELSSLFNVISARNSVISRLHQAVMAVETSLHDLYVFALRYRYDPFGELSDSLELLDTHDDLPYLRVSGAGYQVDWLDQMMRQVSAGRSEPSPMPRARVRVLRAFAQELASLFRQVSPLIAARRLNEAHTVSYKLVGRATAFRSLVEQDLLDADKRLACCALYHSVDTELDAMTAGWLLAGFMLLLAPFAGWIIFRSRWATGKPLLPMH